MVANVLTWWDAHRRALPWRAPAGEAADPYRVWLSEILLQQTTASGAAPYFKNFVARWPDVEALAAAPLEAIMQAFAGLGYYSRARNLHACAKAIAERGGRFPQAEAELRALPGVGRYTAAAIAAIAFDAPTAPVDGNIARVLSRLQAFETPVAKNRSAIEAAARALTPASRPGDFAQAMMDIGATICRPRNPVCGECPLGEACAAARTPTPERFPPRALKKANAGRVGAAFYARRADGAFLARRGLPTDFSAPRWSCPAAPGRQETSRRSGRRRRPSRRDGAAYPIFSNTCSRISRCDSYCSPLRRISWSRRAI